MALDKGTIQGNMPVFLLFNDLAIIHNDSRALLCLPTTVLQVWQLRIGPGKLGGGGGWVGVRRVQSSPEKF